MLLVNEHQICESSLLSAVGFKQTVFVIQLLHAFNNSTSDCVVVEEPCEEFVGSSIFNKIHILCFNIMQWNLYRG